VGRISQLLHRLSCLDPAILRFFTSEHVPDPQHIFLRIVGEAIPHRRQAQQEVLVLLSYCHHRFRTLPLSPKEREMLTGCYQQYLALAPFLPDLVKYHEAEAAWANQLLQHQDLVTARKQAAALLAEVERSAEPRLDILLWRLQLCTLVLDTSLQKAPIERKRVVRLMREFQQLKKQEKVSYPPVVRAFCHLLGQLLLRPSTHDLAPFFQQELRRLKRLPLSEEDHFLIIDTLQRGEEVEGSKAVSAVHSLISLSRPLPRPAQQKTYRPVHHNHEISQGILRKVDHFLKLRPAGQNCSLEVSCSETVRPSIFLHDNANFKTHFSLHETTRLGWFKSMSRPKKEESMTSLNQTALTRSGFGRRRRKEIYRNISKERENEGWSVSRINLQDEMTEIEAAEEERCRLSLEEMLLHDISSQGEEDGEAVRAVGALEDQQFGSFKLSFFSIFNQEIAQLQVQVAQEGRHCFIHCRISSTYCRHWAPLLTRAPSPRVALEDLKDYVEQSIIYYEAIQERVERKVGSKELQLAEAMLRLCLEKELSQQQLLRTLLAVDLAKSEFFWYYTKSSLVHGSRIERRPDIQLEDESAFAVCLSKFKSDYDSCLNELIEVENMQSLKENCHYLSQGRRVVFRTFRRLNGRLLLEVVEIAEKVYRSVRRVGKVPSFEHTWLERYYLDLEQQRRKCVGTEKIDARALLRKEDVFIFFMKNIIENFIEIKYVYKIDRFLAELHRQEHEERSFRAPLSHHLEHHASDDIFESSDHKNSLADSLLSFREPLLAYAEAHRLKAHFRVVGTCRHFLKVGRVGLFLDERVLSNGMRLVKYCRAASRRSDSLLLFHG
jgi:hypothetical protein